MPKLHVEALIFSLTWAALAIIGGLQAGFMAGAALSAWLRWMRWLHRRASKSNR